jgi:hypothetical protein
MVQVIVDFRGVCTHFRKTPNTPVANLPVPHRVVVVDATHLPPDLRQRGVKPHKPFLFFSADGENGNGRKEPLGNGVTLTIRGAAGEVSYDENYKRLPRLLTFQKDYVPCSNVVDRYAAACYFDIQGGTISTVVRGEEISVRWTVTLPDGIPPVVLLTRENGDVEELPVPEGMIVMVDQSTEPAAGHGHNDFLLHYLTSEVGIPGPGSGAAMPGQPSSDSVRPPTYWYEAMTAACSNSGYP